MSGTRRDQDRRAGRQPQAGRGQPLHPRQGQLHRRHHPARHAAHGDPAQPAGARADQVDRRQQGVGHPRRAPGAHRRDDGDQEPGLDADPVLRHPGRAGHRQGAVPGPGGGLRHRRRPVHRQGRVRGHRRRLRAAAGHRQPGAGGRRGRPGHQGRQGEPGRQRHLRLGGRRQGRHRPGVRAGRRDLQAEAALPALAPVADRVLRVDRGLQPGHLQAHRVHDHPGAAHHPGRGRAGGRAARAHDPDHLPGHRRRVRQQGAGLPRVRLLDPGLDPAGAAGEVDRGQVGQPHLDRLRPGRLPGRRDGAAPGRQDPRRPDPHRRRPRRVLLRRPAEQVQDRPDALGLRRLRHPGRAPDRPRHLQQQGAGRGRLPVLVPGHRGDVLPGADDAGRGRRPRHGPGGVPPDELRPGRAVPAPDPVRLPDRLRPVRQVPGRGAEGDRLRGLPARAGRGQEAGQAARPRASPP